MAEKGIIKNTDKIIQNINKKKNMIQQVEFSLRPLPRGFHLVTNEVMRNLPALPKTGILNLFVRHTSCGLSLNERLVPDGDPRYLHQDEGPTDMSAHAKSSMVGVSLTIPITNGRLNLGTWQGIYLCEFREGGGSRHLIATIIGE